MRLGEGLDRAHGRRRREARADPYQITRPLAPPYSLHTVILKVEPYNDTPDPPALRELHLGLGRAAAASETEPPTITVVHLVVDS